MSTAFMKRENARIERALDAKPTPDQMVAYGKVLTRAYLLRADAESLKLWATVSGDATLIAAADDFEATREVLYNRANRLKLDSEPQS